MARPLRIIQEQHEDASWALGPLSRLTTRLAARFDWARDRTVSNLP